MLPRKFFIFSNKMFFHLFQHFYICFSRLKNFVYNNWGKKFMMYDFYIFWHKSNNQRNFHMLQKERMLRLFELEDNHQYQKTYISNHHSLESSHYHQLIPAPCCYYIKLSFQALTLEIVFHWLYARNSGGLLSSLISCYTSLKYILLISNTDS